MHRFLGVGEIERETTFQVLLIELQTWGHSNPLCELHTSEAVWASLTSCKDDHLEFQNGRQSNRVLIIVQYVRRTETLFLVSRPMFSGSSNSLRAKLVQLAKAAIFNFKMVVKQISFLTISTSASHIL
jgi:hypothetical protein